MDDEDFDNIFSKKNILEGLNDIIEAIRQEGVIENDIGNDRILLQSLKKFMINIILR